MTTTVNIYLTFNGNCKAAFDFYKTVFGGEFSDYNTFGEMPPQESMPNLLESDKNKIMHVCLPISKETMLMGSDTIGGWGPPFQAGNNFSISVNTGSKENANKIFQALAVSGKITMPLEKTFWGAYFGMLTDKFGVNWMVNSDCEKK